MREEGDLAQALPAGQSTLVRDSLKEGQASLRLLSDIKVLKVKLKVHS